MTTEPNPLPPGSYRLKGTDTILINPTGRVTLSGPGSELLEARLVMSYARYDVHAVRHDGFAADGQEWVTQCEDNDPERLCFGLYGIHHGMRQWVSDHPTRQQALQACQTLLNPPP